MQRGSEVPLFLHNRPRQDTGHLGPRYIFRFRAIRPQLQYIRLCHIQIPGQMQTPKVFLLLSCILHQYRTSAKAFSVQDPLKGKVQRINSAEGCKSSKTLLFCQILKGSYIWQIVFQCVLDKDPCILPYHCDLQEFCVLICDILLGQVSPLC